MKLITPTDELPTAWLDTELAVRDVELCTGGQGEPVPCPLHPTPETVSDLADSYARQVDELAGTVEHCMAQLRVVAAALGELHVALDEIAHISRGGRIDA